MAVEKVGLGTENDPDVLPIGNAIEVTPERSRQEEIRDAAEILVLEEDLLVDDEIDAQPESVESAFDANLVEEIDKSELS